ncbi:MAG: penicillin-binding protein activator LpoB [Epsilonproteobacteria bacterium]|nr:penicillin-binding protein activator LpoB [Campylobacterota bacterium]
MKKYLSLVLPVALLSLSGCMSSNAYQGNVSYKNVQDVEQTTLNFGSTDLNLIVEKMVTSLLQTSILDGKDRPVIMLSKVQNKTSEHIDTKNITDKIKTTLLKSGRVRVTSYNEINQELIDELNYQSSQYVNQETAKKVGNQVAADYKIYGEITSIEKNDGRTVDLYYKMTLNLVNIETGLTEWADEKEIRKSGSKSLFSN